MGEPTESSAPTERKWTLLPGTGKLFLYSEQKSVAMTYTVQGLTLECIAKFYKQEPETYGLNSLQLVISLFKFVIASRNHPTKLQYAFSRLKPSQAFKLTDEIRWFYWNGDPRCQQAFVEYVKDEEFKKYPCFNPTVCDEEMKKIMNHYLETKLYMYNFIFTRPELRPLTAAVIVKIWEKLLQTLQKRALAGRIGSFSRVFFRKLSRQNSKLWKGPLCLPKSLEDWLQSVVLSDSFVCDLINIRQNEI